MSWAKQKNEYARDAFTIVELLIVIVIIAILAAITIISYVGIQNRAKASAAQTLLSQTVSKVKLYAVDHSDTYPSSLSAAGITNTDGLQYSSSSSSPSTFCITATSQNVSYYQSSTTSAPAAGACPGHGVNGGGVVVNYYVDPKPVNPSSGTTTWSGGGSEQAVGVENIISTWSASGRANKATWTVVTYPDSGGPTISVRHGYATNQRFTISLKIRLVAGSGGIGNITMDRNDYSAGTSTVHARSSATSMNLNQTYIAWATFTANQTALDSNYRMYVPITNKTVGTTIEYADIDLYPGDYDASRTWHSGDSPGWIWNGTANNSTSTGPAP